MNARLELVKTGILLLLIVYVMYWGGKCMSANVPKNESLVILETLIRQEERRRSLSAFEVGPFKEIEEIWQLEDTRAEAEDNLVQSMFCAEYELGYDKQSNTFFCSLGMEGDEWPDLTFYASGKEDLQVVWVDDYTYDSREDAVRNGYSYELFAYTEESYSYFNLVFTGLPIVTLHVESDEEIGEEYIPARATVFGQGFDAIDSAALVHTRGGGYEKPIDKYSYRLEFHDEQGYGRDKKTKKSVLGMEADSDWLLLGNASDQSAVRNYLAFDLWKKWNPDGALTVLENRMVELFVNNEYVGVYQIMQRISPQKEIIKVGGNIETDCAIRVVAPQNQSDKPLMKLMDEMGYHVEYQYEPHGNAKQAFKNLEEYVLLNQKSEVIDDQTFIDLASKHIDIEDLMSYYLFLQAGVLYSDNIYNNHYIWMFWENGRYVYRLSPWDMDFAFSGVFMEDGSLMVKFAMAPIVATRMLDLDCMESRKVLHSIWAQKKETILTDDALEEWMLGIEEEINASGAYLRESEKWYGNAQELNLKERLYILNNQKKVIQDHLDYIWPVLEENKIEFTEKEAGL